MTRFIVLLAFGLLSACASAPPERQVVDDAAAALGGAGRLAALTALTIEATGTAPNAGQNRMPDDELPVWRLNEYTRTIDLANGRTRMQQVREAQFLFAGDLVQRQTQGLDGDVAYNVAASGAATRAGAAAARDRRIELLHHPITIVRAALDPAAKLANPRREGSEQLVDLTTPAGDTVTLAVDAESHLPVRVISMADNANMGDVAVVTTFADYEDVAGVKLPRRLTTRMDKYLQLDLQVTRNRVEGDAADLAAPAAVAAAPVPAPPPVVVTAEPVAKGIWWLAGSGNHRSIVFEFADHLVLYEAPLNEARTKAVIDKARTLSARPLTMAIVSHHHFDHSGGLRAAVAEGLTIVTHRANEAFFKDLLARPHTIVQDALQQNPREAKFVFVDDQLTLKDEAMEVQLYHLLDNPREGTNLFAYLPAQRVLVHADLYDSTWLRHSWGENVLANVEQRKLKVDRHVPVHGGIEPFAQMVATIKSKPGGDEQSPSSSFPRGNSRQSWQDPGLQAVLAKCKSPAKPFSIPGAGTATASPGPPPDPPAPPPSTGVPGVIAAGQTWKVVWQWEGNNADGPIAGDASTLLFANNDASNVMRLDPASGLARIVHENTNTGGAVSRSKNGALFLAMRGVNSGILQLEPQRKPLATTFRGEPLDCAGGVMNDLAADARGGVYFAVTGTGVFYANPQGVVSQYGANVAGANGIILSPDERTLYVTNGGVVLAFDVQPDGSLTKQREFGKLRGGQGGDGSAVDQDGRLYVATGASVDVFAPNGEFLGSIPGPQGLHGTAFGGPDKKTLYGIVFYGGWGTPSARNRVIAIPTIAQGYTGRAK